MLPEFPRALLREREHSWNLRGVLAASQSSLGVAPSVRTDGGGFWTCSMGSISLSGLKGQDLRGKDRIKRSTLLWRAVRQICDGGVNALVVPRNDALFRPFPPGAAEYGAIPHDDETLFDDCAGYYQPIIDVVTVGSAALRATYLTLSLVNCAPLLGGESFSIEHPNAGWRMYEIATVDQDGDEAVVTFNPPLREAVAAGTPVEFDRPRCAMKLSKMSSMDLTVQPWTFNSGSIDFVEAPWS